MKYSMLAVSSSQIVQRLMGMVPKGDLCCQLTLRQLFNTYDCKSSIKT